MPVNALLIRALLNLYQFYGDEFKVECPTGSGVHMTLFEVAKEVSRRLASIFPQDANGHRPVYGGNRTFQESPHWKDYILLYEYFHGDNGAGLGASHQTGWTGLIARTLDLFARLKPEDALQVSKDELAAHDEGASRRRGWVWRSIETRATQARDNPGIEDLLRYGGRPPDAAAAGEHEHLYSAPPSHPAR